MVRISHIAAFAASLSAASASCLSGTKLAARAADGTVAVSKFNYTGAGGPLNWFSLNTSANSACSKGKFQSPIDIVTQAIGYASTASLNFSVPAVTSAKFENLGTNVEVVVNGTLVTSNLTYTLAQFHFHTPSEHRIDEEYFPLEAHFVFESEGMSMSQRHHPASSWPNIIHASTGSVFVLLLYTMLTDPASDIAVVAFVFQLSQFGYSAPLFDSVFAHLDDIATPGTFTKTGPLDFAGLEKHFNDHGVYAYTGSLTTPPCSENVAWYISTEPVPLNVQTYNAVKKVVKFNARYTQNTLGLDNLLELSAAALQH
ncbi:carbonic anhydrase [Sporothrix schenckii 1099-18]|uniref:Carbonic anhydrase n=1 Tax=Sporothrix schenckii 1099-18 TaxID=1397361 RepID=A0A0F2MH67_SPOSC|nr:carbonic anhydrase [Sporothrix schenckii 1099-18]KJR87506.1 carbonic anhydrase [Sporothrix schenckii 1099-18]